MSAARELRTRRLLLRGWRPADLEPFAAMNADPLVMEHFPETASRTASALLIAQIEAEFERDGYGLWVVEVRGETPFAGFVGLTRVGEELPFAPAIEAGWRLSREQWGRGIALEAADAVLDCGFQTLGLEEIVAYTAAGNARSRRLMERLGMSRDPGEDFDHPRIAAGERLAPHVLYRLTAAQRPVRGAGA
jgi:RimJ/RimL family protein N-acetyltransferase